MSRLQRLGREESSRRLMSNEKEKVLMREKWREGEHVPGVDRRSLRGRSWSLRSQKTLQVIRILYRKNQTISCFQTGKGGLVKWKERRRPEPVPTVVNNSVEENEQLQNSVVVDEPVKSVDQAVDLMQLDDHDTKYGVRQEMQATGGDWICDFSLHNSQDTTDSSGNIVLNLVAVMPKDSQNCRQNSFGASLYGSVVKDERDEYIDVVSADHDGSPPICSVKCSTPRISRSRSITARFRPGVVRFYGVLTSFRVFRQTASLRRTRLCSAKVKFCHSRTMTTSFNSKDFSL